MEVKISLSNGDILALALDVRALNKLLRRIGTRKGEKIWVGQYSSTRIVAFVPNEIMAIYSAKKEGEK